MSRQLDVSDAFQRRVNPAEMTDSVAARRQQEIREGQACRLEIATAKGPLHGTGFLIGPDVILTNWHVVERYDPAICQAKAVFDYKHDSDGVSIRDAVTVELAKDPLVASSPYAPSDGDEDNDTLPKEDELDFAVLRLSEALGLQRGWCVLPVEERELRAGEPIFILQHPEGKPLKIDTDAFTEYSANRTRIRYAANTEKGSSGSPCFDKSWTLVALHNAYKTQRNQGIPARLIRAFLERRGIWTSLRADAAQPRLDSPRSVTAPGSPVPYLAPPIPSPFFGREKDIRTVVEGLEQHRSFALVGGGGIGKTSIAAAAIQTLNPGLLEAGVVMHDFYRDPSTDAMALSIVRPFVSPDATIERPQEALRSVLSRYRPFVYLEGCENAEDRELETVRELVASSPFLITTREKRQAIGLHWHEVGSLDEASARSLLSHHGVLDVHDDAANQLSEELGRVPLALELAGAYLKQCGFSSKELLDIINSEGLGELHLGGRQKRSVPLLLEKTAARLSPAALDAWAVMGLDAPLPVSVSVVEETLQLAAKEARAALNELVNYCLLTPIPSLRYGIDEARHYALKHRLIYVHGRRALASRLSDDLVIAHADFYLSRLPKREFGAGFENYEHAQALIPQFENAIQAIKRVVGFEHLNTLASFNNLAMLYVSIGQFKAAKPLYEQALEACERMLGAEHPRTLTSLNNLGQIYLRMGEFEAAKPLSKSAFESRERALGAEHPDTLNSLNNLALLHAKMGELEAAKPLFQRALEVRKRILGEDHPDALNSLHNLATLHENSGEGDIAKLLYKRALETRTRVLGANHPETLLSLNNLAALHARQGEFEAAMPLSKLVFEERENILGPEHPETLNSLSTLALILLKTGDTETAKSLAKRAFEVSERVLGPDHPDTLIYLSNIAVLHSEIGEFETAESLFERAVIGIVRKLGTKHPDTTVVLANRNRNLAKLKESRGE